VYTNTEACIIGLHQHAIGRSAVEFRSTYTISRTTAEVVEGVTITESQQSESLGEQTRDRLIEMLLSGELKPGLILQERRLASILEISRTPLRAALSQLEVKGLVKRQAGRFAIPDGLDIQRVVEAFNLRRLLEMEFAGLAAGKLSAAQSEGIRTNSSKLLEQSPPKTADYWRVDNEFHTAIAEAAGNEFSASLGLDLRRQTHVFVAPRDLDAIKLSILEHFAIADAIMSGDAARSRELMDEHIAHEKAAALSKALGET
jgi:DNA-binding GntR family transcriptional regulator